MSLVIAVTYVLFLVILTEALTEGATKSVLFKPLRDKLSGFSNWLKELLSCGYCFSLWVAFGVVFLAQIHYSLTGNQWVDLVLTAFVVHRLSNILHNIIDKWTDKYYSLAYINTDKSDE